MELSIGISCGLCAASASIRVRLRVRRKQTDAYATNPRGGGSKLTHMRFRRPRIVSPNRVPRVFRALGAPFPRAPRCRSVILLPTPAACVAGASFCFRGPHDLSHTRQFASAAPPESLHTRQFASGGQGGRRLAGRVPPAGWERAPAQRRGAPCGWRRTAGGAAPPRVSSQGREGRASGGGWRQAGARAARGDWLRRGGLAAGCGRRGAGERAEAAAGFLPAASFPVQRNRP